MLEVQASMGGAPSTCTAGPGVGSRAPGAADGRRAAVFGVLNVTPDSFSDGGRFDQLSPALAHAERMLGEGADVIDVGGESTRPPGATYGPGAALVLADEERARVIPVITALAARGRVVSIDTTKAEVASAAIDAGARIVNDVSGGGSPALLEVVAARGVELVLMHSRGDGRVDATTASYRDLVGEVLSELHVAVERAERAGIARERLYIDPGIGFAKSADQSAFLLGHLDAFVATGLRVLVGASRKSFIARVMERAEREAPGPERRLGGSLAAVVAAGLAGCAAVRVHDVFDSVQALRVAEAMRGDASSLWREPRACADGERP